MLCFKERLSQNAVNMLVKLLEKYSEIGQTYLRARMQSQNHPEEAVSTATNENPFCKYDDNVRDIKNKFHVMNWKKTTLFQFILGNAFTEPGLGSHHMRSNLMRSFVDFAPPRTV